MRTSWLAATAVALCIGLLISPKLVAQRPQPPTARPRHTALVDMSQIMKHSARFNQAMDRLKKEYEAKAQTLKQQGERGNQLAQELRQLPPGDRRRKQLEEELMRAKADYELEGKKVTNQIRDSETKIIVGLLGELKGELQRYASASGVQLILRNDPTPPDLTDPRMILQEINKPIVYQRQSDVTPSILQALNRGAAPAARTSRPPAQRPVR